MFTVWPATSKEETRLCMQRCLFKSRLGSRFHCSLWETRLFTIPSRLLLLARQRDQPSNAENVRCHVLAEVPRWGIVVKGQNFPINKCSWNWYKYIFFFLDCARAPLATQIYWVPQPLVPSMHGSHLICPIPWRIYLHRMLIVSPHSHHSQGWRHPYSLLLLASLYRRMATPYAGLAIGLKLLCYDLALQTSILSPTRYDRRLCYRSVASFRSERGAATVSLATSAPLGLASVAPMLSLDVLRNPWCITSISKVILWLSPTLPIPPRVRRDGTSRQVSIRAIAGSNISLSANVSPAWPGPTRRPIRHFPSDESQLYGSMPSLSPGPWGPRYAHRRLRSVPGVKAGFANLRARPWQARISLGWATPRYPPHRKGDVVGAVNAFWTRR